MSTHSLYFHDGDIRIQLECILVFKVSGSTLEEIQNFTTLLVISLEIEYDLRSLHFKIQEDTFEGLEVNKKS